MNIKQEITSILNETPIDERTDRILELLANQRRDLADIVEEYFKGLIVIPDPQATVKNLLTKLKEL